MNAQALPPTTWTTGTTEVFKTGTWRAALPVYQRSPSPCHLACPVNGEISVWIQQARAGDWHGAWVTLTRNNPFPAIAGRICHHPCEKACHRASLDAALAVCALERRVGDIALAEGWRFPEAPLVRKERIAIVGGGPSGLSAAYQLRRLGYAVTLLEKAQGLGGLLREGIPPYRLPRNVLDAEIERLVDLGMEVRTGVELANAEQFTQLRSDFDAVYLAMGASRQKRVPQLDYGVDWVMDGARYLAQSNAGTPPVLGRRLVVIGGGSAALDVARSARRAGHEVSVLSLERDDQMPAQREEIVQGKEEGIAFVEGAMLQSAVQTAGGVLLTCIRVHFEPGPPGAVQVTPIAASEFVLETDAVVPAIGQDPELAALPQLQLHGALLRTDAGHATSLEGVYAGGDVASTARFVTHAIGMGKNAARQIDRWLRRESEAVKSDAQAVPFSAINTFYYPASPRAEAGRLAPGERLKDYAEVQRGLDSGEALAEAERCFSCGNCIYCDNCFHHCPDMAVRRVSGGYAIAEDYCKGCGLCVEECPTGSMVMQEDCR
jgi:NADPH-dependent glutamate synthase beta subunit-like oxidoreductase